MKLISYYHITWRDNNMAKKFRFPLEMENGVEVRSIEELKENFSLAKILIYLSNGKLLTWLRDRYIDDIANRYLNNT